MADTIPGNNTSTATIALNGSVTGTIEDGLDKDWYQISLTAGTRYVFEMKGSPSGNGTLADPKVALYNAAGTLLVSDDDSGVGFDAFLTYTAAATGNYFVSAEGFAPGGTFLLTAALSPDTVPGNNTSTASVAVGGQVSGTIDDPTDTDWYQISLTAGTRYVFEMKGSPSGNGTLANAKVALHNAAGTLLVSDDNSGVSNDALLAYTPTTTGNYFVSAEGFAPGGTFLLTAALSPDTVPGNNTSTASVAVGGQVSGTIDDPTDTDWYQVNLTSGTKYLFTLKGAPSASGTLADPELSLYNSSGTLITSDTNFFTADDAIPYTATASGIHYLGVAGGSSSAGGTFQLSAVLDPDTVAGNNTSIATISVGGAAVAGTIDYATDKDWYQVNLTSGTKYLFTLKGAPSASGTLADPELSLYNSSGTLITSDSNFFTADDEIPYTATVSGIHYLGVAGGSSSTGGTFQLLAILDLDTVAGNNTSTATISVGGAAVSGTIDYPTDKDWYQVSLTAGTLYVFEMKGSPSGNGTLADPKVALYNAAGTLLVSDDNSGVGNDAFLAYTPNTTGNYFVSAEGFAPGGMFLLTAALSPEIAALGNAQNIVDGDATPSSTDHTDFGSVAQGGAVIDRVFTVNNIGSATLTTSALTLPAGFSLVEGLSASIVAGASDTFTVRLDTGAVGLKTGEISFTTNDGDENPFNFAIRGSVISHQVQELPESAAEVGGSTPTPATSADSGVDFGINDTFSFLGTQVWSSSIDFDWVKLNVSAGDTINVSILPVSFAHTLKILYFEPGVTHSRTSSVFHVGPGPFAASPLQMVAPVTTTYYVGIDNRDEPSPISGNYQISISVLTDVNDLFFSSPADEVFNGGTGGTDTVSYASATSFVVVNLITGTSTGGGGNDTLISIENVVGSAVGDTLTGDANANTLTGNAGNDTIFAGAGSDVLDGGADNDTLVGNSDIFAQEADTLVGGTGDDTFYAEFTDSLSGGSGTDFVYIVNSFNMTLDMGATSTEWVLSDFGNDTLNAATQTAAVTIYAGGGNDSLTGSAFDDTIFASVGNDTVVGGDGADVIIGDLGADSLSGGNGNDRMYIDAADAFYNGGVGRDAAYITFGSTAMSIDLAASAFEFLSDEAGGNDTITAALQAVGVEVYAGNGADVVTGSAFVDQLWGGGGNDTLNGGTGDDALIGQTGADVLTGGTGIDALYGNSGGGGDGAVDRFVFTPNWGTDFVFDFEHNVDKLDLTALGTNFAALTITADGAGTRVTLGADLFVIANVAPVNVTVGDFLF